MSNEIWKTAVLKSIDEAYDGTGQIYLDSGTDPVAELRALTGAQASAVLPGAGNSVANQVKHLLTTVKIHQPQFEGGEYPELDWGADWEEVLLTDEEWAALVDEFAATRQQIKGWIAQPTVEENADYAFAAVMAATHFAYHIGQIRHAAAYAANTQE